MWPFSTARLRGVRSEVAWATASGEQLRIAVPRRVGNSSIGLIRPEIDVDARIDKQARRLQVPSTRDNMQSGKTPALGNRVDTFVKHRRQDASVARVCSFEPYSGVDSVRLLRRPVAIRRCAAGCRLAGSKASEQ
jgi:hypothetical protein